MRWWSPVLAMCVACEVPPDPVIEPLKSDWTIPELHQDDGAIERRITVTEAVVISGRTATGESFFVQAPGGGTQSGLRVDVRGALPTWPPEMGTLVQLTGTVYASELGPTLDLEDQDDGLVFEQGLEVVSTLWEPSQELGFALVSYPDLTVTSLPDPHGRADTDAEVGWADAFGTRRPGWLVQGALTGVLTELGRLSPRSDQDWSGDWEGTDPVPTSVLALHSSPPSDGTPVVLDGVVQVAPWSRGQRYTVVQDDVGRGVWIDAEGWLQASTDVGQQGRWVGEVRTDGEGLRLRTWWYPEIMGVRDPVLTEDLVDGAFAAGVVTPQEPPDAWGEVSTAEGPVLDDRFLSLDALSGLVHVTGPVRVDDEGTVRWCATALEAP